MTISRLLFPLTLLISLFAHSAIILNFEDASLSVSAIALMEPALQITRIEFNHRATPTPEVVRVAAKPAPNEEKKTEPKKPVIKPKMTEKLTPIAKTIKASSEPKSTEIEQREAKEKMAVVVEPSPVVVTEKKITSHEPILNTKQANEKQCYLMTLLAHIESHKYYPRPARRKGIEGYVNVSFLLFPSGELSAVKVAGGPALLHRAARKAVQSALPLPKPPSLFSEPLPVKYRMAFILQ